MLALIDSPIYDLKFIAADIYKAGGVLWYGSTSGEGRGEVKYPLPLTKREYNNTVIGLYFFYEQITNSAFLLLLFEKQWTNNSQKLAIRGAGNGGLLVGAVMTQRPDLFKVALPAAGVMDMLRFHRFTVGRGWTAEYGNAGSASQFSFLYNYSPCHNLREGVHYPVTLVTTADHDDRPVPAHSYKFAARLQEHSVGDDPVLIRIETNAGIEQENQQANRLMKRPISGIL